MFLQFVKILIIFAAWYTGLRVSILEWVSVNMAVKVASWYKEFAVWANFVCVSERMISGVLAKNTYDESILLSIELF